MSKRVYNFEELLCWKKSKNLAVEIYKIFSQNRDFGFKDQIQRAGVSISNNIAEGFERQTNKELIYFLYVAKGSCGETRNLLIIGNELGYIDLDKFQELYTISTEVSKMISGLIKSLANNQ